MATESIKILSRTVAPAELLDAVKTRFPDAAVAGDGPDWREITLTFGDGADAKQLILTHDPDTYTGPSWPDRVRGMQGYFGQFPAGDQMPRLMGVLGSLRFALGTRFEPEYTDPAADDRFGVILGVTRMLDGVICAPSGLWDGSGRMLVAADGEHDADAEWPATADGPPAEAGGDESAAPTPDRVARRALALVAVTARAVIEREVKFGRLDAAAAADMHARLLAWVTDVGIDAEFEAAEEDVLATRPGRLADRPFYDAMWRVEGLEVLGWALGRSALPRYDDLSTVDDVWNALGFLDADAVRALLEAPTLRPREELEAYFRQARGYHWRLRQYRHVGQATLDFRAFAAGGALGSFDVSGFDLIDGDLALRGERIDRASDDVLGDAVGIAQERHLAASWLCHGPVVYSQADVST